MVSLLLAAFSLLLLEIVLGVDNIVILSLLVQNLDKSIRKKYLFIGIFLAILVRIVLLFFLVDLMNMVKPIITVLGYTLSARDIFLICGGLFLVYKAVTSMHEEVYQEDVSVKSIKSKPIFVILQIITLDLIFSLDSLLTSIGLTQNILLIVIVMLIAVGVMLFLSGFVSRIIAKFKTVKMLVISFVMMIGIFLFLDGIHIDVDKQYLYFAMGFSLFVEIMNLLSMHFKNKNNLTREKHKSK